MVLSMKKLTPPPMMLYSIREFGPTSSLSYAVMFPMNWYRWALVYSTSMAGDDEGRNLGGLSFMSRTLMATLALLTRSGVPTSMAMTTSVYKEALACHVSDWEE